MEEAFNRRASDNLGLIFLNLSPVRLGSVALGFICCYFKVLESERHAIASVSDMLVRGATVKSDVTRNAY